MDARSLPAGSEIHWYRIESVLGQGGFGITYLAHDTNLDRRVAIKEYLPATLATREGDSSVRPLADTRSDDFSWGLDSFLAEARTLARFRHANIVGVHSVFEANNTAYMVMEYERGESLALRYRRGDCREQDALERIFFPILDGLGEIHRLGFIHRDIKPSNIYIREDGTAVLIDFGSARRVIEQRTGEITSLVSQGYTPLEQYSANYGEQGPWTDVYSLGATMYEGIVGTRPEDALSRSACLLRRRPDPVEPLSSAHFPAFDARFLDAVSAALALQPEERPADLEAWLARFRGEEAGAVSNDEATRLHPRQTMAEDEATRLRPADSARRTADGPDAFPQPAAESTSASRRGDGGRGLGGAPRADAASPTGASTTGFADFELDDLEPPTHHAGASSRRGKSRPPRGRQDARRGRGVLGALAAFVLVAVLGGGAWWYLAPRGGGDGAPALDPALVASLPSPPVPLGVRPRDERVVERLDEMARLASLYREALAAGADEQSVAGGTRALREELGALAFEWHPERHADIVGRIERVAALLPPDPAAQARLQSAIASAAERSDLDALRALLDADAIVEPAGAALIDRVGRLGRDDYRALVSAPGWTRMMRALGEGALESVRAADFDSASLLVAAALTLQPDEPFMRRLGEHLGGRAGGS